MSTNSNYFHLGSDMLLFKGFQVQNNIKAAKHSYDASTAALEDIKDKISIDIASIYLQILMNQEEIENAENQLLLTNKLLERAKVLIEVGEEKKEFQLPDTNGLDSFQEVKIGTISIPGGISTFSVKGDKDKWQECYMSNIELRPAK